MLNDWIVILVVLLLSAFFSAMEIAYIASSRLRIELDRKEHPLYFRISGIFLSNPGQYLSTILIGNNIALVIYSMSMATIIAMYITSNIVVETFISSIIVILFAEFLPKAVVKREPHLYLRLFAIPLLFFYLIFYPIAIICTLISRLISFLFTGKLLSDADTNGHFKLADLQDLVEDGVQQGEGENDVQASDLEMFQKALDFSDLKARDCMVPRVEIEAIDVNDGIEHLSKLFISSHYSRIPVFEESVDNIIGYVSSKSLFRKNSGDIKDLLLDIIYVPESFSAQRLLEDFIRHHKSLAVVIDEFGATAGIVTIEDIIEQIVGDIEDEHDEDDMVEKILDNQTWIFSGRQEIEYINEKYRIGIPVSDEYDTLAGWILFNSEELPEKGAKYELDGLFVEIIRAADNRISLVKLSKQSNSIGNE